MQLMFHDTGSYNAVAAYDAASITVNETRFEASILVMPQGPILDWSVRAPGELDPEDHLPEMLDLEPEVIVLGTGENQVFPEPAFLRAFLRHGIGCEVMDTGAACRTYNVLASENRVVLGAFIIP
ncbi:MAG: Mth938-like domain-containing protein [Xanthomonadales bacterium]|nr:Mth938-like domain-containing protein [Xanthomonadales bacterium]